MTQCPLCGYRFDGASRDRCRGCQLAKRCRAIACPNCCYEFVEESATASLMKRIFGKGGGDGRGTRRHKHEIECEPAAVPLCDLGVGDCGLVTSVAPAVHNRMTLLASLGIVPGTVVEVRQKSPAYVIRTGESEFAFDKALTDEIFVSRL